MQVSSFGLAAPAPSYSGSFHRVVYIVVYVFMLLAVLFCPPSGVPSFVVISDLCL